MKDDFVLNNIKKDFPEINIVSIKVGDLIFEERVKMNCFYCGKYDKGWMCPPRIPDTIRYSKMIKEYENAAFVYIDIGFNENNYEDIRTDSTILLHRALLKLEKYLWNNNFPLSISFIGGSCKLCKNGCNKERCNNPQLARVSLEGIGINVVKSAEKYGIKIDFPPQSSILRIGLILW